MTTVLLATACGRVDFAERPDSAPFAPDDAGSDGDGAPAADAGAFSCAGYTSCDDFEGDIGNEWTLEGDVTIDATVAHRGTHSLHVRMPALTAGQQGAARIYQTAALGTVPPTLWVRGYFRIGALPVSTNALELITVGRENSATGNFVFLRSNDVQLYAQLQNDNASAGTMAPLNTWLCIVFEVSFATTAVGTLTMTSDVIPPLQIANTITNSDPPVDYVSVGPNFASPNVDVAQPAFDMWIDDVIVDDQPVGCAD